MIDSLKGEYFFLSNFFPTMILGPSGIFYPTLEHAYQAAKTSQRSEHVVIQSLRSPGQAKRYGRRVVLVDGWDAKRIGVMYELLKRKFSEGELRKLLLATAKEEIFEGNNWGDRFWGVDARSGVGENHLGKLLMKIREELR